MKNVVIATTTWYKSLQETRAQLALRMVNEARRTGYQIVIVDSSSKSIKNALRRTGATIYDEEKPGMGNTRRQAFREAEKLVGQDGIIIWMEPEKVTFVPHLRGLVQTLIDQKADLLIPRRKSVAEYPPLQQSFEFLNNLALTLATGLKFDHCVGTRIFRTIVADFFSKYYSKCGEDLWDILMIPIVQIERAGYKVIEAEVDYHHPTEQTADDESPKKQWEMFLKRNKQLQNTIAALKAECRL